MPTRLLVATLALSACAFDGSTLDEHDAEDDEDDVPLVDAAEGATFVTGAPGEWVWNDIAGARCGNGGRTGIGVSLGTTDDVLVYLEGGGLCWDEESCTRADPPVPGFPLAPHVLDGFTGETFRGVLAGGGYASGIFDRTHASNPYRDATHVYVPYCTGDVHTGRTEVYFPGAQRVSHFAGRTNLDLALTVLRDHLPAPTRVTLAGRGAGAYGATFNYALVADRFAPARVDLVADSGPILPVAPVLERGYAAWNTKDLIPADCFECTSNFDQLYGYYALAYPASRFAFITHAEDGVIAAGHAQAPYPAFYQSMKTFTQEVLGRLPNWRSFVAAGEAHTSVDNLDEPSVQTGLVCVRRFLGFCIHSEVRELGRTLLGDWLTQMRSDAASWNSVTSQ